MEILAGTIVRNVAGDPAEFEALQHHQATGEFMPCGLGTRKNQTLAKKADPVLNLWKGLESLEAQKCLF